MVVEDITALLPGDVIFVRTGGSAGWAIRKGEAIRFGADKGSSSPSHWNHVALYMGDGWVAEMRGTGAARYLMSAEGWTAWVAYRPFSRNYRAVLAVGAAAVTVNAHTGYDWLGDVSEAIYFTTRIPIRFGWGRDAFCSGAVAEWLTRGGLDLGMDETWRSPSGLYRLLVPSRAGFVQRGHG